MRNKRYIELALASWCAGPEDLTITEARFDASRKVVVSRARPHMRC
jgi:hypothetical protein